MPRIAHIGEPTTLDWHWSSGAIVTHTLNDLYEAPVAMGRLLPPARGASIMEGDEQSTCA